MSLKVSMDGVEGFDGWRRSMDDKVPQSHRISSAVEINFVCGRNKNRLRTKFFSSTDEIRAVGRRSQCRPPTWPSCGDFGPLM